jgi:hypothetical protein
MIKKGTEIKCAKCNNAIYITAKDINSGDPVEADQFEDIGFGLPESGEPAVCPVCDYPIIYTVGQLL